MPERSVAWHQPLLDQRRVHPKAQAPSLERYGDLGLALGREHPLQQRGPEPSAAGRLGRWTIALRQLQTEHTPTIVVSPHVPDYRDATAGHRERNVGGGVRR
jgi:hypothetical protein